jgi:hypothetical protein
MTPEQVIATSIANVARARNQIDDVEWSAEDGTRSEMDFLCRVVEAVIKAGATTVNIPDTVGYTVPEEYTHFMRTLIERVPNSDKAVFSVHCHNDQCAQRQVSVLEQDRHHHADAGLQAGLGGDVVSGAVQQGDRRPERVCP